MDGYASIKQLIAGVKPLRHVRAHFEALQSIKARLKVLNAKYVSRLFEQWSIGLKGQDIYMRLSTFLKALWRTGDFPESALYWGRTHLTKEALLAVVFGGVNFDDMTGCQIHKDLLPCVRRRALLSLENLNGRYSISEIQNFVRFFEGTFAQMIFLD